MDAGGGRNCTNSASLPPKPVDLPLLMELCSKIAGKWRHIGTQLRVPNHELDTIQANNRGDPHMVQNCLSCMFNWWLKNGQDITPEKFAQAIHNVDEHGLEVDIRRRFDLSCKSCHDIDYVHHLAVELDLQKHVQSYCCDTKKRYIQQPVLPESDWPPTLGGQYIRLALIKQGRTIRDFTHHAVIELQKDYVRGKYDKILEHKSEIELEEIFDPVFCDDGYEVPLKMLIDGAPGVGKTTISRKVCQKWANGELLQGYWLILLLHLRERSISKAHMIDSFFYHDDQMVQNATVTFVKKTSGKGVLVIFDGFDELSSTERQKQSLFLDIVKGKVLSKCAVVVTSRPYASRPVQELQSVNRHIEVLGFTNEQIKKCIKQRINDRDKAEELCIELEDRLDIASICQIPLNCSIVLYVYEMEGYKLPNTLTKLYELFILHGLRRYITRTEGVKAAEVLHDIGMLPTPIHENFKILTKVAFNGLKEDKLVFERRDLHLALSPSCTFEDLPTLDLMTSAKSYSSKGTHDTYTFLHLIIQEYLSAFWAAENLSKSEKLDFLRENLKNERFYMVLWFFAGITRLNIENVHAIFSEDLCEYDNHVHICHLLYESDSENHSLCSYVANNCITNRKINLARGQGTSLGIRKWESLFGRRDDYRTKYSRFDSLMIAHFLAHSCCEWTGLILKVEDIQLLHKGFNCLKSCTNYTVIQQVTILVNETNITNFCEGVTSLLDEIPQVRSVEVKIVLYCPSLREVTLQAIKCNIKNILKKSKTIKSIYMETVGGNKHAVIRNLYDAIIEGIAHDSSLVNKLELQILTTECFEYLISLLAKWNSNLKLVTLSVFKNNTPYCHEERRCHEFCGSLSSFLSNNTSLRQINMSLPFNPVHLMNCIDSIQCGLNQNSSLEELTISCTKEIVFQRNRDTPKLELVKGHKKLNLLSNQAAIVNNKQDDAVHSITVPQCGGLFSTPSGSSTQSKISTDSESPWIGNDVDSFQATPAKRQKMGNSSKESPCQTSHVYVQPQHPQQLQSPLAVFSTSHLQTLTHSPLCRPLYFSQCATATPQSQPSYCMAGSSSTHGTYHTLGLSRNYQVLPQEQNDHQYQNGNMYSTRTHLLHGRGVTNTLPPMRPTPPTVMHNRLYPMPYQQQTNEFFSQSHVSNNYCQQNYNPVIVINPSAPAQPFMVPPRLLPTAGHLPFILEPEQYTRNYYYNPAVASPTQTIYYPSTETPSTTGVHVGHSLPTTSTST